VLPVYACLMWTGSTVALLVCFGQTDPSLGTTC